MYSGISSLGHATACAYVHVWLLEAKGNIGSSMSGCHNDVSRVGRSDCGCPSHTSESGWLDCALEAIQNERAHCMMTMAEPWE